MHEPEPEAPFVHEPWRVERFLPDGTKVIVRALQPSDIEAMREGFARLSPETRYMRFFSAVTEPSEAALHYLTEVDQHRHVAICAGVESLDLKEEKGIGVARYVRVEGEPHVAEAAVTVVDAYQKRGVGTLLLTELARAALSRGVRVFRGEVLAENHAMLQILESVGAKVEPVAESTRPTDSESLLGRTSDRPRSGSLRFEVTLQPDQPRAGLAGLFRAAASSMSSTLREMFGETTAGDLES